VYLEELQVLKLVDIKEEADGETGRPANVYRMSEKCQELVRSSQIYPERE
jgi:predicted ArsR family transcriptional regulator